MLANMEFSRGVLGYGLNLIAWQISKKIINQKNEDLCMVAILVNFEQYCLKLTS